MVVVYLVVRVWLYEVRLLESEKDFEGQIFYHVNVSYDKEDHRNVSLKMPPEGGQC